MPFFDKPKLTQEEKIRRACDEGDDKYIQKCMKKGKALLLQTVRILGEEQMDPYMPKLCELLTSPDRDKRLAAAYALGEMRYSSAVTFLARQLEEEEDEEVREEIQKAIAKFRG